MAWPSSSCFYLPAIHGITTLPDLLPLSIVIHGITILPSLILSTLTIKCVSVGHLCTHLCTHLTGNSPHVGPLMTPMSESGTHEPASSFPSFQCPSHMTLPSHLLPLTIPSPTDSLLLCSNLRTQFASLMSITVICTVKFWVKKMQIWCLYEMEQRWHAIGPTLVWEHGK